MFLKNIEKDGNYKNLIFFHIFHHLIMIVFVSIQIENNIKKDKNGLLQQKVYSCDSNIMLLIF